MIYTQSTSKPPHLFRIGHQRRIQGEWCILISYTPGKSPRPKYRRQDGSTFTVRPAIKRKRGRQTLAEGSAGW